MEKKSQFLNEKHKLRKARANVFLDFDDMEILALLYTSRGGLFLDNIKKGINMSHKGLLTHINRLKTRGFISVVRSLKDYKFKIVGLTKEGEIIIKLLISAEEKAEKRLKQGEVYIDDTIKEK